MNTVSNTGRPLEKRRCTYSQAPSEDEIYEQVMAAIFDQRLAPGTKLGEHQLASIFGVSRARIRRVLPRLAHEGMVQLEPNRGAFVAEPTIREARDVIDARRIIEPALAHRLAAQADRAAAVRCLRDHVLQEARARDAHDVRAMVRLSGEFHILLAQKVGNLQLEKVIRKLATRTCLVIALYDRPLASHCLSDEHMSLIEALEVGDSNRASQVMREHLSHVETGLRLERRHSAESLEDALSKDAAQERARTFTGLL